MGRVVALALFLQLPLAAGTAADLARAIRETAFDRGECYRVRDLNLVKEDIRIYLTDGHLIFSQPVAGRRIAAVFTADTEGGDGEVMVFPPDRAERSSLAAFTHSPNLDDHFRSALFLFTGAEYDDLQSQIAKNPGDKKMPEIGALMDQQWTPVLRNLAESYQTRLVLDLISSSSRPPDLLTALFDSPKLGTFDVIYDPRSGEQVVGGQLATRDNRDYFDDWFSFTAASLRRNPTPRVQDLVTSEYRIEASIGADLSMSAVTRVKVRTPESGMAAAFDIAPAMTITAATVDGVPAEVLQPESVRANLLHGGNEMFLVVPPQPLQPGRDYEFEFHHEGKVIVDTGDRVFYVADRGNWYPIHGMQFATYDLTFRYPRNLDLVAPGDVVEEHNDGDWRVARRLVSSPIRMAGFNLGDYAHARTERGGYTIDICANRQLETALQPRPLFTLPSTAGAPSRRNPIANLDRTAPASPPAVNPLGRLQTLADEVASALEFMAAKLGPPALPHLTVSPIPGTFGQGFPGLIYLSTLSYLRERPAGNLATPSLDMFFDDILQAHETAHQWWGNRVITENYRDSWLMEALANYTALLYLEKRRGPRALDQMLAQYRTDLLQKNPDGDTVESAGPIVLGQRLQNSQQPAGWRAITYGKGSWILHMLRRRMGDQRFVAMLGDIAKRYDHAIITTDQFRQDAAHFLPPKSEDPTLEGFFDQWVYGTGIPALKLTYAVKGRAPALRLVGTLEQSGVDDDFSTLTPVEIQVPHSPTITRWIASSDQPVTFSVPLKQAPVKVTLDPRNAVLRR